MPGHDTRRRTEVAMPMVRFALASLLAVIVAGAIGVTLQRKAAHDDAIRNARTLAHLAGDGIVAPNVNQALLDGDADALRKVDRLVKSKIVSRRGIGIVRVKIWDRRGDVGRIVYSDLPSLIGKRFELPDEEAEAFGTDTVHAETTDLKHAENRFDGLSGKLLEVYLPIRATTDRPLLFEIYRKQSAVSATARKTWEGFAPALIGALLLLGLLQLPLAYRMARTLHDNRHEREARLLRAIAASDTERRRIAGDLHDGVVQDLAGLSFALAAGADRVPEGGDGTLKHDLRAAAEDVRRAVRRLRTLLVEIHPPNLHRTGLEQALSDLLSPLK